MIRHLQRLGLLSACAILIAHGANASSDPGFDGSWSLCADATHQVERERGIPKDLLTAISLAESGRWDNVNGETHAWPWTVTSGENTWKTDSKAEAIQRVQALRGAGVTNIDVGCMQINLRYHPDAFESLEQAFDPLSNARYAGTFLSNLYGSTGNWLTAAGNYHSNTQQYHERYKLKVARFWNDRRNDPNAGSSSRTASAAAAIQPSRQVPAPAEIDYQRMAQLNQAFRARQTETRRSTDETNPGAVMPLTGDRYALNAQIQRVRKQAERRNEIDQRMAQESRMTARTESGQEINPDLLLWRNLYRSGPTNGPFLSDN